MTEESEPREADCPPVSPGSWGVVCTTNSPNGVQLAVFLAHHLEMGAAEIFVYLDTPTLMQSPVDARVRIISTDNDYWQAKGGRPEDHRARQISNANDALQRSRSAFIAHLDDDELIYSSRPLHEVLSELAEEFDGIEMPPCEPCFPRIPRFRHELYTCPFRRRLAPGIRGEKRSVAIFGEVGRVVVRGLQGHRMGKCIIRNARKRVHLGIHRAKIDGRPARCRNTNAVSLLHVFSTGPQVWLEKYLRRLQTPRFLREKPHRMRQWALLFRAKSEQELIALYRRLNIFSRRQRWLLFWQKALLQPDLSIEAKLGRHFPQLLPELRGELATFNSTIALHRITEARQAIQNDLLKKDGAAFPVPIEPHMPPKEVAFLAKCLARSRCFLEFGSGGSTVLAAQSGVKDIYSVDTDTTFLKRVAAYVLSSHPGCGLWAFPIDLGPTKRWGYPLRKEDAARWPNYFTLPWAALKRNRRTPDLVLVDGRFRVACFLASLLSAAPGTIIVFDDYNKRHHYHVVERFIRPKSVVGRLGVFRVPQRIESGPIALALCAAAQDPR
jgi:hypothetical protein